MDSSIRVYRYKVTDACDRALNICDGNEEMVRFRELKWFANHADQTVCLGYEDFKLIQPYLTV